MRISGFTMVKNAEKLYYPVKESIISILPLVDEFIVALGDCDTDDHTREIIASINTEKIKIIDTVWDVKSYPNNMELAHQTDIAMSHCTGDWLFYLQSDEVVHQDDIEPLRKLMLDNVNRVNVEGILFKYIHLWGDYQHQRIEHGWYKREIRIVKPIKDLHSWCDAQSFRVIPNFDGKNYFRKENTRKLNVIESGCRIFHYGWVRPPRLMIKKLDMWNHHITGNADCEKIKVDAMKRIYHFMDDFALYNGEHPKTMEHRIAQFDWEKELDFVGEFRTKRNTRKLFVTFLEQKIFKRPLFEFKNFIIVRQ